VIGRSCVDVLGLHVGERALECSSGCPLVAAGPGPDADLGEEVWRYGEGGRRQPLLANASAVAGPDGTVAEVVQRNGEGGGRGALVLVHGHAGRARLGGRTRHVEQDEHGHNRMTESHPFSLRVILDGAGRTE